MAKKEDIYKVWKMKMVADMFKKKKVSYPLLIVGIGLLIFGIYVYLNPGVLTPLLEKIGIG